MAPVDSSPTGNMSGFEFICSLKADDTIPVHKYKSVNTGITVLIAEVDGPVVCGFLCLATEAFDDDGLPHTLEHLIFLGSEDYPYKGVLDLIANRCFACGTNAQTDVDNTYYTMTTAGSDGFLSLLPIYIDHVLYPTLKESAFLTEVHHITGEGEDAGVVYCEMQSKANIGEYLTYIEMCRAIYPGHCGYKSNTGGALENLRESTNNEKVKHYHKEFYRPENLMIIITGQIKHVNVFKALQPVEEKIMSKGPRGPFKKPWQSEVPPLTESKDIDIYYPCDDEDNGCVNVAWRGPSSVTELYDLTGCSLLLKYLTDTSVSPLQKAFVEIKDPLASNVRYCLAQNSISMLYLIFENVPKPKVQLVKNSIKIVLNNLSNSSDIDMKRMKTVIQRHILETLSHLETSPHEAVTYMLLADFLYGNTKEDLDKRLNQVKELKKLMEEPHSYWIGLLHKYLINGPMVIIKGIPSVEKQLELTQKESDRVSDQIENLGEEGLKKKEKELEEAIIENEKPIPDELLTAVPVPSTESINFHSIKSYTTETVDQHPRLDVTKFPFFTHLVHINTNFLYMFVIMDTQALPREYKPYLPLLLEALMECPVNRNGKIIPYEEVVSELEADTVAISTRIGFESGSRFKCGSFSQNANLMIQVEPSMYAKAVQWIKELLFQTQLTAERLKIIATRIVNDVAQIKRDGSRISSDLMKGIIYNKDSNHYSSSLLRQQKFLTKFIEQLSDDSTQKEALAEIEEVRKIITTPKNMVLYMVMNVDKFTAQISHIYEPWAIFDQTEKVKLMPTADWTLMNDRAEMPVNGCVTGIGSTESTYLTQVAPGIKDFQDPDLAALLVCFQYLIQLEGPIWRQVRGQGLSYGYSIFPKPAEGLSYLSFYKATNVIAAYNETKAIVESHVSGGKWEKLLYESAKSSLIFMIIDKEKSVGDMVMQSLLFYLKNVPHDYNHQMVNRISHVTIEDIDRVAKKYLVPLFDPKKCNTTIVCHPSKASEIFSAFTKMNHDLKLYDILEETYLND
ncbi:uncharacterized protein C05D11.1-like [Prorops nasuta]|uniref:uncharacterized protein C05D11.1-like n=1 Tax=Prorops nasuta TaxID=863751 RepID=UPI0034CEF285